MDPEIQGYPAGFAPALTLPNIQAFVKVLNGQVVNKVVNGTLSIGIYRPQKEYYLCLSTVAGLDGHEIFEELYISLIRDRSILFNEANRLSIAFTKDDIVWTQLELSSATRVELCKVFACFAKHNFDESETDWEDGIETKTKDLRNRIQKSPGNGQSFTRVKAIINKDRSDLCTFLAIIKALAECEKVCLDFGNAPPDFEFTNCLDRWNNLKEIEVKARGWQTLDTARFLIKLKQYPKVKSLILFSNHPDLKERDLQTKHIIRHCSNHITTLGVLFDETIPHMIEYLRNLKHLYVSIHNLFSYRLFSLPNLKTINVASFNSYKQNFFPATALGFTIDKNLVNTGYFAFDTVYYIEKTITKHIPSLFELAAGSWYSNPDIQKCHLPDYIQSRLFHGRVDFQLCTSCNKIFNDKLFSAWIIRKKNDNEKQYFKHKFCHDCYEQDRRDHLDYDVVMTRNNC